MTAFTRITLAYKTPVAHLTLAHPPQNVIDVSMMEELAAALAQIDARDDISILLLTGSERAFSAGVDVAAHTPDNVAAMLARFHAVVRALVATKKVTVAAVRGNCLGGGAELPLVCDLVYTTKTAKWGFPEIQLACFPPIAAVALSAVVGQKRAANLVLTGRVISGEQAAAIGLANAAVDDAELDTTVESALAKLRLHSVSSLAITKKALYAWDAIHFDKGLARAEKIYLDELMKTEDAQEGIQAWIDKRTAVWRGK